MSSGDLKRLRGPCAQRPVPRCHGRRCAALHHLHARARRVGADARRARRLFVIWRRHVLWHLPPPDVLNPPRTNRAGGSQRAVASHRRAGSRFARSADHHRLGNPPTKTHPFTIDPVGSTSNWSASASPPMVHPAAGWPLCCGLMADTLIQIAHHHRVRPSRRRASTKWALALQGVAASLRTTAGVWQAARCWAVGWAGASAPLALSNNSDPVYEWRRHHWFGLAWKRRLLLELSDRLGEFARRA